MVSLPRLSRGDIVVDVTLYGIKRQQSPPPVPAELDGPPSDAEFTKTLDSQMRSLRKLIHSQTGGTCA